jgi:hypothetical protein
MMNLTISFHGRATIKMFVWGTMYIFIVAREMIVRGMTMETTMKMMIVIKRKVLRKMIAMMKTMSHQFRANRAGIPSYFRNPSPLNGS